MRKIATQLACGLLGVVLSATAQVNSRNEIPVGTSIEVRTNDTIDIRDRSDGRVYTGVVTQDVRDANGQVAIPRGANAELAIRNVSDRDLALDLDSVTVNGRRYVVSTEDYNQAADGRKDGLGKNSRTGKYVGGGALLGTVLGAIAGGGKGAAIGAAAGAAAGAGTQVLTRGREVRVPAESVLTFRLDQPLQLGRGRYSRDNGYDRDGRHYHRDDDRRNNYRP